MTTDHLISRFVPVKTSQLHYYTLGAGDPILFLHGIPTSAFLWRHILPSLSEQGQLFAPDLIGMGRSDKPDIEYRVFDHIAYIDGFIEALQLKNITLVMHGWGSVIGFDYARRHPDNVKALAFYEPHLQPVTHWDQLSLPVQQFATLLDRPGASYRAIVKQNYFIEKLLSRCTTHQFSDDELNHYRTPFLTPESRKPLWQYVNDLPLGKGPSDVIDLMQNYSEFLQKTPIPKLFLYAIPGFMTTMNTVQWANDNCPNLELSSLDNAMHLAQESMPQQFSTSLSEWYHRINV